jgi:group I intron endonuclease
MNSGIYQIRNVITGDTYIGQAVHFRKRQNRHWWELKNNLHSNRHLQRSVNKHGLENFEFNKLVFCEREELTKTEQYLVDFYQPEYNMCKDVVTSCLGVKRSQETKDKIRIAHKGKKLSEEHKQTLSRTHTGLKQSAATIEKRRLKMIGKKKSPELVAFLKGFSEKAVIQICPNTGNILAEYQSLVIGGKSVGVSGDAIGNHLAGRSKTSGGFIWKFKNEIQCQ